LKSVVPILCPEMKISRWPYIPSNRTLTMVWGGVAGGGAGSISDDTGRDPAG
jgi:hypothetical protein